MNVALALKKIRSQIKFGHTDGVDEKLSELADQFKDTGDEIPILELYALDYLPDIGDYEGAIPKIERLLSRDISGDIRVRALGTLNKCKDKLSIVPSNVDVRAPEFVEAMSIIRNAEIFSFAADLGGLSEYVVLHDIESAKKTAWHQSIEPPFQSWNALRSKASAEINARRSEYKINVKPLRQYNLEVERLCEEHLSNVMMNFFDDISGDLSQILMGKALGVVTDLHSKMWEAYQKKAFPCGWNGEYPQGKLCVFVP